MILFLAGWTVGCVFLTGAVIREQSLFIVLFAIPFWASWLLVFCVMLKKLFAREEFLLDISGAKFQRWVFVPIKTRCILLDEIEGFLTYSRITDNESGAEVWGIEMYTLGKSLQFAEGLPDQERLWLEWQLDDLLDNLRGPDEKPALASGEDESFVEEGMDEENFEDIEDVVVLELGKQPRKQPSDCRWQRVNDFDSIQLFRQGRLGCGTVLSLLFVNAFWNGMVSVFVLALYGFGDVEGIPEGIGWWGMFVFLIPFELIGLGMFIGLLAAVTAPLQRTAWQLGRNFIERRSSLLGLGPRKMFHVDSLRRIEVRYDFDQGGLLKSLKSMFNTQNQSIAGNTMAIVLIDNDNIEVCTIGGLTKGEAFWIGDVILREREAWFA